MSLYVQDNEWGTKYPHFQKSEFRCPCGNCDGYGNGIASTLLINLERLRDEYGALIITSGYRCPSYNASVGGVSGSKHMEGLAADFVPASGITNDQEQRAHIVNEVKDFPYYHYSYCNYNGNYPNMGNAVHYDTLLVDPEPTPEPQPEPVDDKDKQIEELNAEIEELNNKIALQEKQIEDLIHALTFSKCEHKIEEPNYYKIQMYKDETLCIKFAKDTTFEMQLNTNDNIKVK